MTWRRTLDPIRRRMRTKLLAAVLAALLPAFVAVASGIAAFTELPRLQADVESTATRMHLGEESLRMVLDAQSAVRGYVISGEPELLAPYDTVNRELPDRVARLTELTPEGDLQRNRIDRAGKLFREWRETVARPTIRSRSLMSGIDPASPAAREMMAMFRERIALREGERMIDEIRWLMDSLEGTERSRLEAAQRRGRLLRRKLLLSGGVGVPVALVIGIAAALGIARRATRSLSALTRAAAEVESGRVPAAIPIEGIDELAHLARAFNRMTEKEAARSAERAALSELTQLLQTSESLSEAVGLVEALVPRILPVGSGAVYFFDASRYDLELTIGFGASREALAAHFPPTDCWALRLGRNHRAATVDSPRCEHGVAAGRATICVPMAAQGEVFGAFHYSVAAAEREPTQVASLLDSAEALGESLALQFAALRLRETLRGQSIRDPLTGVYNRRYFDETFERELRRAERHGSPLALLLIDLDHFKRFNDDFGHEAGDMVLRELGAILHQVFRASDLPCRLGGEEFAVLLPEADVDSVRHRVTELATRLRNRELRLRKQKLSPVTLSAGLAGYPVHGTTAQELMRAADEALYAAKSAGRDRLKIAC